MAKVGRPPKRKNADTSGYDRSVATLETPSPKPETQPSPAQETSQAPAENNYPVRRESSNRISIPIDQATGKIAWDEMQDRTIARTSDALKKSMSDAEFIKHCGIAPITATAKPQIMTPIAAGELMDVIARVEAGVYAKKTGLEYAEVYEVVAWDKDDHRILDAQASALANKYMPASWLQYADLGVFATTMFALMKQKAALVDRLAKTKLSGYEKQMRETSPPSNSVSTPTPPLPNSPATSTVSASTLSNDIPPGEMSRSLEDFSQPSAPSASNNGEAGRSLG
jgi:hypothetical protein